MKPCLVVAAGLAILTGCGKSAESLADANTKLFQSADPAIKSQWEAGNAAIRTNGYFEAILAMKRLQAAQLTPEQRKAVDETVTAVSDQMYEKANAGDAAAKAGIERLRTASGR